jgi:feruloyl esterase
MRNALSVAAALVIFSQALAFAAPCESLASLSLPDATITSAESVDAGAFAPPGGAQGRQAAVFKSLAAFCRVALTAKPTSDSDIRIEVWMPATGWNNNLRGVGNVGLGGSVDINALAATLRMGYAAVGSDTGHQGDSSYALNHPEKVIDFGYRAAHEMTVKAKAIIAAFYGNGPKFSFMEECGGGTIPALGEAQRYPADYDGIAISGFGAYKTHHIFSQLWIWQAAHETEASYIPKEKLAVLHNAVLKQCDALDGVTDGLIEDPTRCKFDPGVVECKGADGPECLTAPQVAAARKIYAGLYPGSELGWLQLGGPQPLPFAADYYKFFVYRDPNWDAKTRPVNFDADVALADKPENLVVNAVNPDLRKFFARGGKLVIYEGWADYTIPPGGAIDYYKSVEAKAGAKSSKDSMRLFMVPGGAHCGQERTDEFNRLTAIEQWVENGKAPDQIIATRVAEGKPTRTRPLCPYPQVAAYKGSGSTDDAANFACKMP